MTNKNKELEASFAVEAACVVSITILVIAWVIGTGIKDKNKVRKDFETGYEDAKKESYNQPEFLRTVTNIDELIERIERE